MSTFHQAPVPKGPGAFRCPIQGQEGLLVCLHMVYLIGGAPRVGKSLASNAIAEALHVAPLSTDDVCDRVTAGMPEEERASKFPLPSFSGDPAENTLSPEEWVKLQVIGARSLQPEIDRLVAEALSKQESLVLEGVHLLPDHVQELLDQHGADHIRSLFVGSEDAAHIVDGIQKNTNPNNWLKESDPAVIRQVAECVAAFSAWIRKETESRALTYMERTDDFEGDLKRFVDFYANPELNRTPR